MWQLRFLVEGKINMIEHESFGTDRLRVGARHSLLCALQRMLSRVLLSCRGLCLDERRLNRPEMKCMHAGLRAGRARW